MTSLQGAVRRSSVLLAATVIVVAALSIAVSGISEEEAGLHDWTLQHVGVMPLAAHFFKSSDVVGVVTRDAIAALRVKDGSILWRIVGQIGNSFLASDADDSILAVATREGNDDKNIRVSAYRADDGNLLWSVVRAGSGRVNIAILKGSGKPRVLVSTPAEVVCLSAKNAQEFWTTPVSTLVDAAASEDKEEVVAEAAAAEHVSFRYDPSNDKLLIVMADPVAKERFRGIVLDTEQGAVIRTEDVPTPQCTLPEQQIAFRLPDGDSGKLVAFCVEDGKSICTAAKKEEGACFGSCSSAQKATKNAESDVSIVLEKDGPSLLFAGSPEDRLALLGDFVPALRGLPVALYVSPDGKGKRYALLVMEDASWSLFDISNRKAGSVTPLWIREEALSQADRVEFVDLPLQDSSEMMSVLKEDAWTRILHRSQLQFAELCRVFRVSMLSLQRKLTEYGIDASFLDSIIVQEGSKNTQVDNRNKVYDKRSGMFDASELVQDEYNFEQRMVVTTRVGKIFGMRPSLRGDADWTLWLGKNGAAKYQALIPIKPAKKMSSEKTTLAFIRVFENSTAIFFIEPISGKLLGEKTLSHPIMQSTVVEGMLLVFHKSGSGAVHATFVSKPSEDGKTVPVVYYPQTNMTYFYVYSIGGTNVKGYSLKTEEGKNSVESQRVWTISLAEGETIAAAAARDPREVVHNPGRIFFGNRTIREKYLNPNLFAMATTMEDGSAVTVYIVDGVTGRVIHRAVHTKSSGPIHMVLTENSCVYHFRSNIGYRIGNIDLYHVNADWKTTRVSAYQRIAVDAYCTAFNFPHAVTAMGVTQTLQGNTVRLILMALESGQVFGLDRRMLDSRRPRIDPDLPESEKAKLINQDDQMDGILTYHPRLPVNPQNIISYNQTIEGVNGVAVSRTNLESTCLVVAHGFDMFFARVYPAKRFDLLKADFSYILLIGTVVILVIAHKVLERVVARRAASAAFSE